MQNVRFSRAAGKPSHARCAVLIGLSLVAGGLRPAGAQGINLLLNTGDALTVSGVGTTGLYQGLPVTPPMSGYTIYTDDGKANASHNYAAVEADGTAAFTLAVGGSLNDANGYDGLLGTGSGLLSVTGGAITGNSRSEAGISLSGSSPLTISGGSITEGDYVPGIASTGTGLITLSGGTITSGYSTAGVSANGSAGLMLSGATIAGGDYGVDFENGGPITMSAGSISTLPSTTTNKLVGQYGLYAYKDGLVTLSGGTITGGTPPDYFAGVAVRAADSNVTISGATLTSTGYTGEGLEQAARRL